MSPTPPSLKSRPGLLNLYGPGAHLICYPVSASTTSWAITSRDPAEAQETWRIYSAEEMASHRDGLMEQFRDWSSPVPELLENVERIIKYGLYDRPHLEPHLWYSPGNGRSILIGDAAHPTSPHLGQGANQALYVYETLIFCSFAYTYTRSREDCYHLSRLLPTFTLGQEGSLSVDILNRVFHEFATMRQPRTANLVKGARAQGELRVKEGGPSECQERDNIISKLWGDHDTIEAGYDILLREPFQLT